MQSEVLHPDPAENPSKMQRVQELKGQDGEKDVKRQDSDQRLAQFTTAVASSQGSEMEKALLSIAAKCKDEEERKKFMAEMQGFKSLFDRFKSAKLQKPIDWEKIKPPPASMVVGHDTLPNVSNEKYQKLLSKLAVLKLNGGLGTSMGCSGPKSVIEVHKDLTFLDLTVHQIEYLNNRYSADVPLVLMNSFNTHEETLAVVSKYKDVRARVLTFNQSRFPRILKESLLPMPDDPKGNHEHWYPPGHGDIYQSIVASGVLDRLVAEGKEYIFVSNVDNLGATVDFKILNWIVENGIDFCMEVTNKTRSDVKGGTLIEYEGKAKLFEIAQCPSDKVEEFKSIKKFKIFNTNNLWISLRSIKKFVEENKLKEIDVIVNPKKALGKDVIQLETACGAAIQFSANAKGVNVSRSRFLPVKNVSDLLLVQSNLYEMENGTLYMSDRRQIPSVPLVNLGEMFKKVDDYNKRFAGIPDILELDQLTVSGDVTFGDHVCLKGTVIIVANHGNRIDIPSGAVLENKVISGNMRILDL